MCGAFIPQRWLDEQFATPPPHRILVTASWRQCRDALPFWDVYGSAGEPLQTVTSSDELSSAAPAPEPDEDRAGSGGKRPGSSGGGSQAAGTPEAAATGGSSGGGSGGAKAAGSSGGDGSLAAVPAPARRLLSRRLAAFWDHRHRSQ